MTDEWIIFYASISVENDRAGSGTTGCDKARTIEQARELAHERVREFMARKWVNRVIVHVVQASTGEAVLSMNHTRL